MFIQALKPIHLKKISITIVDDHQLFRAGLKLILGNIPDTGDIFEIPDGESYLEFLQNGGYTDIVFMDIEMPDLNGIETSKKALQIFPSLNIIALSMYSDEHYYTKMIDAGAKGFILKNSGIEEVETAIQNVLSGNNYFSHEILTGIVNSLNRKSSPDPSKGLSEREEEVLYMICKGLSNQEIADYLFISKRTVDKHRENLLLKTQSKNTAGLVIYAIKSGIVEL